MKRKREETWRGRKKRWMDEKFVIKKRKMRKWVEK
jgi:hypothetical protein